MPDGEASATTSFGAIVLAGERPGGSVLARALGLPAAVLAPLAGRPCLERVLDAVADAREVSGVRVAGPAHEVVAASADLQRLLARPEVSWAVPAAGPAASARAAAEAWDRFPLLLTSGDHGLLAPEMIDGFCRSAREAAGDADLVVGLVPFSLVRDAFPESRRTRLRFSDGTFAGSNLFALLTLDSLRALEFWRSVEAARKQPWKIARRLGAAVLMRYLLGRLPVDQAFEHLSRRAGCRVTWVPVPWARAAVDVDSEADWRLADQLLAAGQSASAHGGEAGR